MKLKSIFFALCLLSLLGYHNRQAVAAPPDTQISGWLNANAGDIFSTDPAQFETHMKEIEPYFTKEGFKGYKNSLIQGGYDKRNPLNFGEFCVLTIKPAPNRDGYLLAEGVFLRKKPALDKTEFYDIDEADLLTVPPKTPSILDVKILKPEKYYDVTKTTLIIKEDERAANNQGFSLDSFLYQGNAHIDGNIAEKCNTGFTKSEQLDAYEKVKSWLERDLKIINSKIDELKQTP